MKLSDALANIGQPIAYFPRLRKVTGSVNATIVLCQLIYWTGKQRDPDGWIQKRAKIAEDDPEGTAEARNQSLAYETGMTYREERTARRLLRARGLILERYDRVNHKLFLRVDFDALRRAWERQETNGSQAGDKLSLGQATNRNQAGDESGPGRLRSVTSLNGTSREYPENTSQTTAESSSRESAAAATPIERDQSATPEEESPRIPGSPVEAMRHPAIRLFQQVCARVPREKQYRSVVETIGYLQQQKGEGTVAYLQQFWLAWSTRKRRSDGRPYDPSSLIWLTEWAINGTIPPEIGAPNETDSQSPARGRPPTEADRAVAERINERERKRRQGNVSEVRGSGVSPAGYAERR